MSIPKIISPLSVTYNNSISDYSPFSSCLDQSFWDSLDTKIKKQILDDGNEAIGTPFPTIYASDYMDFTISGNRNNYETIYFSRRHILNKLILAECAENKGRFLPKIIDGIWLICEESSWVLPAHNTYVRDTPQAILPDSCRPILDLFACETSALLSMAVYLLQKQLDDIAPAICKRVASEINYRIITPYINEHFWWMGNEEEPMCNWTVWCTQNILLTAFLPNGLNLSDSIKRQIFEKSAYSIDCFLKDYGEDGCCDEGAQYYRHAGLCLFGCLDVLNAVSNNHFISMYSDSKIKNIAMYICNMHIDGPYYFNFADCSSLAGKCGAREYLFGKATKQDKLMQFAAEDYFTSYNDNTLLSDESQRLNLYYRTQSIYHLNEIINYHLDLTDRVELFLPSNTDDLYYESVGIWIVKNNDFNLAVKTGNNNDSHNHNDTGSLILYKNNRPILCDIGVETYTKKTFSPDRYDIWTMQSCYHNLPTINGLNQSAGEEYCASDISITNDNEKSELSMNINTAYEGLNDPYTRKICFDKNNSQIIICDTTDYKDVVLNFITYEKPTSVCEDSSSGNMMIGPVSVIYKGASVIEIETLPITDPRLMTAWDHDLYRIRMKLNDKQFDMVINT